MDELTVQQLETSLNKLMIQKKYCDDKSHAIFLQKMIDYTERDLQIARLKEKHG